ncbi:MAG: glucoamylase family protein, partial [Thermoanaerobaculum sp.]
SFYGFEHVGFAPLFGHQYSHLWVDFRGIYDAFMREKGIDYFENSRRAVLSQRAYAQANPGSFRDYGKNLWGLSACDGPADVTLEVNGRPVRFYTYAARGASHTEVRDDGTLCPTAVVSSLPFAPEVVVPATEALYRRYRPWLWGSYGFLDALNPTFRFTEVPVRHGRVVPDVGWFDTDYLGIDQGPMVIMIENYRSELVWRLMRGDPVLREGLKKAGFTSGWLDSP